MVRKNNSRQEQLVFSVPTRQEPAGITKESLSRVSRFPNLQREKKVIEPCDVPEVASTEHLDVFADFIFQYADRRAYNPERGVSEYPRIKVYIDHKDLGSSGTGDKRYEFRAFFTYPQENPAERLVWNEQYTHAYEDGKHEPETHAIKRLEALQEELEDRGLTSILLKDIQPCLSIKKLEP